MQADLEISDEALAGLVGRFYGRVREDALIGPVFNDAIADWPAHLAKLERFWSSVMLTSGRYKGKPVAAHLKHVDRIEPVMFERWLALWRETTAEIMAPAAAAQLQQKAEMVAESLQLAIRFRPGQTSIEASPARARPDAALPRPSGARSYKPYRSTPVFDQDSLPAALRREHRTKPGTWGAIHLLAGELRLHVVEPARVEQLSRGHPGIVEPEQTHWVEPLGAMRMRIDFHDGPPAL